MSNYLRVLFLGRENAADLLRAYLRPLADPSFDIGRLQIRMVPQQSPRVLADEPVPRGDVDGLLERMTIGQLVELRHSCQRRSDYRLIPAVRTSRFSSPVFFG